jgi:DNA mismatch repair protein MutL
VEVKQLQIDIGTPKARVLREEGAAAPVQPVKATERTDAPESIVQAAPAEIKPEPKPEVKPEPAPKKDMPPFKVIGVAFKTYILVESGETMLLIDQHAAHERLQYEKLMRRAEAGTASQQLLTPIIVHLSAREMAVIQDNLDTLADAGYSVEPFGQREIRINAVPFILGRAQLKPIFLEMLQSLSQLKAATIDARRAEIMQMACKSAVKAGDALTESEISALISDMMETGAPPTCPHGRPVVKTMTKRDLEKMFKRIQ